MSTPTLTLIAFIVAIAAAFGTSVVAMWRHRVALSLASAGGGFILLHIGILLMAWSSLVQDYFLAYDYLDPQALEPDWPAWAGFATWQYNLSAIIGLSLLGSAVVVYLLELVRKRRHGRDDQIRLENIPKETSLWSRV